MTEAARLREGRAMNRIVTVLAMTLAILTAAPAAAQQAGKMYRIGYMAPDRIDPVFRQGLSELGYVEGKNLAFEFREGSGPRLYRAHAKGLVALKVDLILAVGIAATRAAKQATSRIPIVMGNSGADPVREGLIDSLARPGGNVTGVFDLLPDLAGKRLELLKEIFPKLSRVSHFSPESWDGQDRLELGLDGQAHLKELQTAARALGVQVQALRVKGYDDLLEPPFQAAVERGAEAGIIVGVGFVVRYRKEIINLAAKYRLPTMHTHRGWVPLGGLISYTTDPSARYRRAAWYVDRIFKGAKPADLPVERPSKYVLEVNLKTARTLGITIPQSIMVRATNVIE